MSTEGSDKASRFDSWRLNSDRIVSLSAMAIGIGSLFIILYQTQLMREAQQASALPYLAIALSSNPSSGVSVNLRNVGVGPALIDDVRVRYQGREIEGDPYQFYLGLRPNAFGGSLSVDNVMPGRLIPAGEAVAMLGLGAGENAGLLHVDLLRIFDIAEVPESWYQQIGTTRSAPGKAVIEIDYSSVYGNRWRIRSDAIVPEEL